MNKVFLHAEGLMVLVSTIYFYSSLEFSWMLFIVLLFVPDISMVGYLYSTQAGALLYNIFHTYILSLGLILAGIIVSLPMILTIGLIWTAHIGMDRTIGYGLKYPTDFKDTHLQKI